MLAGSLALCEDKRKRNQGWDLGSLLGGRLGSLKRPGGEEGWSVTCREPSVETSPVAQIDLSLVLGIW